MRNLFLLLISVLSGCSFHWKDNEDILQHRGFLWYSITQTDRVQFYELNSFGLQFRFQPDDIGVNLGYRKFIALQPAHETFEGQNISSNGVFRSHDVFTNNAVMLFKKQYGIEVGFGSLMNGMSIGYDQKVIVEGASIDESVIKKIDFYENNPLSTSVFQSTGDYLP